MKYFLQQKYSKYMTITIKSFLTAEQNHPMKAEVVHLARANFRIQITNWSVNVLQAKIILHLPFWFVILFLRVKGPQCLPVSQEYSAMAKRTERQPEGAYNNSLEFTESLATVLSIEWIILTVFSIWNMMPSSKAWFMIGSCQAFENGSIYAYHTSMNEENLEITV